eukprot:807145-Rhodomonas_salina.2
MLLRPEIVLRFAMLLRPEIVLRFAMLLRPGRGGSGPGPRLPGMLLRHVRTETAYAAMRYPVLK